MSEQNSDQSHNGQSNQSGKNPLAGKDPLAGDDPLAELARLLSGEDKAAPKPVSDPRVAQSQQHFHPEGNASFNSQSGVIGANTNAAEPAANSHVNNANVAGMDLETQLMAELSGQNALAVSPAIPAASSAQNMSTQASTSNNFFDQQMTPEQLAPEQMSHEQMASQHLEQERINQERLTTQLQAQQQGAPGQAHIGEMLQNDARTNQIPTTDQINFDAAFNSSPGQPPIPGQFDNVSVNQPAPVDEVLDIEDAFSDAFADELYLEMTPQVPDLAPDPVQTPIQAPIPQSVSPPAPEPVHQHAETPVHHKGAPDVAPILGAQSRQQFMPVETNELQDLQTPIPGLENEQLNLQQPTAENAGNTGLEEFAAEDTFAPDPAMSEFEQMKLDPLQTEAEFILPPPRKSAGFKMATIALGIAMLAGTGVVGYGLLSENENNGEPALVRADQSEFKVKPDEPGGKKISNQDQPVYSKMAGENSNDESQERLIAIDEAPVELATTVTKLGGEKSSERLTTTERAPAQKKANSFVEPRMVKTVTVRADGTIVTASAKEPENITALAPLADDLAGTTSKIDDASTDETKTIDGAVSTGIVAIPSLNPAHQIEQTELPTVDQNEVAMSKSATDDNPIVQAPPSQTNSKTTKAMQDIAAADTTDNTVKDVEPVKKPALKIAKKPVVVASVGEPAPVKKITVPASSYVVQISSQRSRGAAEASYQNLKRRFASLLSDKPRQILESKVDGKGTFFRVRIPMGKKSAATGFCSRFKSAGGSCFVTK